MKKIHVRLPGRAYDVLVGRGIAVNPIVWIQARTRFGTNRAFVFADARLRVQRQAFLRALRLAGWQADIFRVTASEKLKDFSRIFAYFGRLLKLGADRHSVLFALGGGTVGDAIGFVAGTYLRGVRWIGLPTTLLAQVDSAIGGKTGVNHAVGKNIIGVFHQPSLVVCDTNFLTSLSKRDRLSGLGEMIKYGLIYDPSLWRFFQENRRKVLDLQPDALEKAITACVKWKARAVALDERDVSGVREALNFGHTVGHALEALTHYGYFRHGEAILLGMRTAAALSVIRGHLAPSAFDEISRFLSSFNVPKIPPGVTGRKLLHQIRYDKKARAGRVRFVLLKKIGQVVLDNEVRDAEFLKSLATIGIS